jgi:membrane protease YdiL (CAAX protease family)
MKERLGRSDYRFLAVCLVLFSATVWYSVRNFHRAFPEASIDFRVSRTEGESMAANFLHADIAGYRSASSFTFDDEAKTFLEREAGLEVANRIMGSKVRLWRWSYRWFRPLQKEEYRVDVTPKGEVVGVQHILSEDAPRPTPSAAEARAIAENFLRTRMQRDPASLEFLTMSETTWPHRTDRAFTWQEPTFNLHDARYRIEVNVVGNEPSGYREYLKIPEQWTRDYQRMRSKNEAASGVDTVLMLALVVGLIVVIVLRVRGHDILWRRAATVGVIGIALSFLAELNQMPLQEFNYPTTDSYSSFMLRLLLNAAVSALGAGGLLFVLTAGAEPLYREMFPGQISVGNLFSLRGLRTKRFFLGAVLGLTLTGIAVAYQTVFYIQAYKLGAWSPADVPYDDLLNTRFPWAFVLFGGFFPAVSEEFLFRMFAIPFLRKLFRSMVLAIVVAGFIWGFGHTAYPQQPFYIRGIEVGLDGVVVGFLFLKFGILPALIEHYSIDAMYTAMLLLRSPNLYYRLSGAASAGIILIPIAAALFAYWRHGGFRSEEGLLNVDEHPEVEPVAEADPEPLPPDSPLDYHPLGNRVRIAAFALLVAGVAALLIPIDRFGDRPKYKLPAVPQTLVRSFTFLTSQGIDLTGFHDVTVPAVHWDGGDDIAAKYFLERLSVPDASAKFEQYRPIQHWRVRYFKPLNQEEMLVTVHPESGKILGYSHTLPEDQPGADLAEPAARQIAAASAATFGWDTNAMDLKENGSDKKKARRDYTFVWEARPGDVRNVDEARYRITIGVAGDKPVSARGYWKLPEEYLRARERQNFVSIATLAGRIALLSLLTLGGVWSLIRLIRQRAVPWRFVLNLGAAAAALTLLREILTFPLTLEEYPTAIPLETFRVTQLLTVIVALIAGFFLAAAATALIAGAFPDVRRAFWPAARRVLARDAAVALAAAAGLFLLVRQIAGALIDHFHAQALLSPTAPTVIATATPSVAAAASVLQTMLVTAGALVTVVLIVRRSVWLAWTMAVLLPLFALPTDIRTPGEWALNYTIAALSLLAAAAFCRWFGRRNYLAYAVVLWLMALAGGLAELYGNTAPVQFWILVAIAAAGLAWALLPWGRRTHA